MKFFTKTAKIADREEQKIWEQLFKSSTISVLLDIIFSTDVSNNILNGTLMAFNEINVYILSYKYFTLMLMQCWGNFHISVKDQFDLSDLTIDPLRLLLE